jgi:hypothetical protein
MVNGWYRQCVNHAEAIEIIALRMQLAETEAKLQQEQARPVAVVRPSVPRGAMGKCIDKRRSTIFRKGVTNRCDAL